MTTPTLVASLVTAAAIGAAGYAAYTGVPGESRVQVSPHASVLVPATPRAVAPATAAPAVASPRAMAPTAVDADPWSLLPRECHPEQGIDRDCEYL